MAEQIEQLMRQVKLGGMAKGWRSVPYENTEQYVTHGKDGWFPGDEDTV